MDHLRAHDPHDDGCAAMRQDGASSIQEMLMPPAAEADGLSCAPAVRAGLARGTWPIIVTGATGWLGQAALDMLDRTLGEATAARVIAFAASPRSIRLPSGRLVAAQGYAALDTLTCAPPLILHFAFRTRGHAAEPGYVETNRAIAATMARFLRRNGATGFFLPSSGAAQGAGLATNPYGALKAEDEARFGHLADTLGVPKTIIRIFNLAGPHINNMAGYALASIILDCLAGRPIHLRAAHPVWRSYAHIGDLLNIALANLLARRDPGMFDTAGTAALEIGALAQTAARLLTGRDPEIIRPAWETGPPDRYIGDAAGYAAAAARHGLTLRTLDQQILDTAAYLRGVAGTTGGGLAPAGPAL